MGRKLGAVPMQMIEEMIDGGFIRNADKANIQPASLDLMISDEIYRLRGGFIPKPGEKILDAAKRLDTPEVYDISKPLEVGVTYLVRIKEYLKLPKTIYAYTNPKSSSGRIDLLVRMLADGVPKYDAADVRGYGGKLWALITPNSFRVLLSPNDTLLQMRFFNEDTRFKSEEELEINYQKYRLMYDQNGKFIKYSSIKNNDMDGTLTLTVNLDADQVGWRCEKSQDVLDFSKRNYYDPEIFFQPIYKPKKGILTLHKEDFYILFTKEIVKVPAELATEMKPIDTRTGEYRSHYAGYGDPGFNAPFVLEMCVFRGDLTIEDGRPICKLTWEKLIEIPYKTYGQTGSHYQHQKGPRLSKHFKQK